MDIRCRVRITSRFQASKKKGASSDVPVRPFLWVLVVLLLFRLDPESAEIVIRVLAALGS